MRLPLRILWVLLLLGGGGGRAWAEQEEPQRREVCSLRLTERGRPDARVSQLTQQSCGSGGCTWSEGTRVMSGEHILLELWRDLQEEDLAGHVRKLADPLRVSCRGRTLSLTTRRGPVVRLVLEGEAFRLSDESARAVREGFEKRRMRAQEAQRWLDLIGSGDQTLRHGQPDAFATLHLIIAREQIASEQWESAQENLERAMSLYLRFHEKDEARPWHARLVRTLESARASTRPLRLSAGMRLARAPYENSVRLMPMENVSAWWEGERVCIKPGIATCRAPEGDCSPSREVQCYEPGTARWTASEPTQVPQVTYADFDSRICNGRGGLLHPQMRGESSDVALCRLSFEQSEILGVGPEPVMMLERGKRLMVLRGQSLRRLDATAASKLARTLPGSLLLGGGTLRIDNAYPGVKLRPIGAPKRTWPLSVLLTRPFEQFFSWESAVASPDQRWVLVVGRFGENLVPEFWLFAARPGAPARQ